MSVLRALILFFTVSTVITSAPAGRPVYHPVTLIELTAKSSLIISAYPSPAKPDDPCPSKLGMWQIHHVLKGDPGLAGKRIAITSHQNELIQSFKETKGASFSAELYREKTPELDSKTSILFLEPKKDGCIEFAAVGAQENPSSESVIASIVAGPTNCDLQLRAFRDLTEQLPHGCKEDSDCKAFAVHPNSCEGAIPLNRSTGEKLTGEWLAHLARIRNACGKTWSSQPACEMNLPPVRCRESRCRVGLPANVKREFNQVTWMASCAPHDAASVSIVFKTKGHEFPLISVNWWGEKKPKLDTVGTALLDSKFDPEEFSASFCPAIGKCVMFRSLRLKVSVKKADGSGDSEFDLTTFEGDHFQGSAPLPPPRPSHPLCG